MIVPSSRIFFFFSEFSYAASVVRLTSTLCARVLNNEAWSLMATLAENFFGELTRMALFWSKGTIAYGGAIVDRLLTTSPITTAESRRGVTPRKAPPSYPVSWRGLMISGNEALLCCYAPLNVRITENVDEVCCMRDILENIVEPKVIYCLFLPTGNY